MKITKEDQKAKVREALRKFFFENHTSYFKIEKLAKKGLNYYRFRIEKGNIDLDQINEVIKLVDSKKSLNISKLVIQ